MKTLFGDRPTVRLCQSLLIFHFVREIDWGFLVPTIEYSAVLQEIKKYGGAWGDERNL